MQPKQPKAVFSCSKVYATSNKLIRQPALLFPSFLGGLRAALDEGSLFLHLRSVLSRRDPGAAGIPSHCEKQSLEVSVGTCPSGTWQLMANSSTGV